MQYSMLPVERVAIGDLWKLLTAERAEKDRADVMVNGHAGNGLLGGPKKVVNGKKGPPFWWSR